MSLLVASRHPALSALLPRERDTRRYTLSDSSNSRSSHTHMASRKSRPPSGGTRAQERSLKDVSMGGNGGRGSGRRWMRRVVRRMPQKLAAKREKRYIRSRSAKSRCGLPCAEQVICSNLIMSGEIPWRRPRAKGFAGIQPREGLESCRDRKAETGGRSSSNRPDTHLSAHRLAPPPVRVRPNRRGPGELSIRRRRRGREDTTYIHRVIPSNPSGILQAGGYETSPHSPPYPPPNKDLPDPACRMKAPGVRARLCPNPWIHPLHFGRSRRTEAVRGSSKRRTRRRRGFRRIRACGHVVGDSGVGSGWVRISVGRWGSSAVRAAESAHLESQEISVWRGRRWRKISVKGLTGDGVEMVFDRVACDDDWIGRDMRWSGRNSSEDGPSMRRRGGRRNCISRGEEWSLPYIKSPGQTETRDARDAKDGQPDAANPSKRPTDGRCVRGEGPGISETCELRMFPQALISCKGQGVLGRNLGAMPSVTASRSRVPQTLPPSRLPEAMVAADPSRGWNRISGLRRDECRAEDWPGSEWSRRWAGSGRLAEHTSISARIYGPLPPTHRDAGLDYRDGDQSRARAHGDRKRSGRDGAGGQLQERHGRCAECEGSRVNYGILRRPTSLQAHRARSGLPTAWNSSTLADCGGWQQAEDARGWRQWEHRREGAELRTRRRECQRPRGWRAGARSSPVPNTHQDRESVDDKPRSGSHADDSSLSRTIVARVQGGPRWTTGRTARDYPRIIGSTRYPRSIASARRAGTEISGRRKLRPIRKNTRGAHPHADDPRGGVGTRARGGIYGTRDASAGRRLEERRSEDNCALERCGATVSTCASVPALLTQNCGARGWREVDKLLRVQMGTRSRRWRVHGAERMVDGMCRIPRWRDARADRTRAWWEPPALSLPGGIGRFDVAAVEEGREPVHAPVALSTRRFQAPREGRGRMITVILRTSGTYNYDIRTENKWARRQNLHMCKCESEEPVQKAAGKKGLLPAAAAASAFEWKGHRCIAKERQSTYGRKRIQQNHSCHCSFILCCWVFAIGGVRSLSVFEIDSIPSESLDRACEQERKGFIELDRAERRRQ
ncbi:hypothetical protein DFH07DRAFT_1032291 [Mycena maculata]|uniref:Uncharacterized protein n=1 Tax=Mycena maculata TaxID=230809 RepID=A0AAD7IY64_9AGAR|nr:hypothetical protein DFH07DRAFT_1032291 [Mycena maculata]